VRTGRHIPQVSAASAVLQPDRFAPTTLSAQNAGSGENTGRINVDDR